MAAINALPRAAILYLFRKHLTRDAQTIIIQPQYYRKYQKWAEFICNKVIRTKLFDGYVVVERCILNDYLKSEPIVCSVPTQSFLGGNNKAQIPSDVYFVLILFNFTYCIHVHNLCIHVRCIEINN